MNKGALALFLSTYTLDRHRSGSETGAVVYTARGSAGGNDRAHRLYNRKKYKKNVSRFEVASFSWLSYKETFFRFAYLSSLSRDDFCCS